MAGVSGTRPGGDGRGTGAERQWSRRIAEALRRNRFFLHAQRIVDVASGETRRHELFLRMGNGEGLIPAGEFVAAAEDLGSIREIDRWVMGRAVQFAAAGNSVHVNLSVQSANDELLARIRDALLKTGADPTRLGLELSESQLVSGNRRGEEFLRGAHELGCRIALDGFVTGGRGAVLLKRLPIDFVKLGPPFVKGLSSDGRRRRKVRNASAKAHESGQRVIAQGVEDLITVELLPDLAIDEAQGYALGRPEPAESALPVPA